MHPNISCPFPVYSVPLLADHGFGFTLRPSWAGRSGVEIPLGARDFYLAHNVLTDFGAHPASYSMGTVFSPGGLKGLGREVNYSPTCSAEVKNERSYANTPPLWRGLGGKKYILPYGAPSHAGHFMISFAELTTAPAELACLPCVINRFARPLQFVSD